MKEYIKPLMEIALFEASVMSESDLEFDMGENLDDDIVTE